MENSNGLYKETNIRGCSFSFYVMIFHHFTLCELYWHKHDVLLIFVWYHDNFTLYGHNPDRCSEICGELSCRHYILKKSSFLDIVLYKIITPLYGSCEKNFSANLFRFEQIHSHSKETHQILKKFTLKV